MNRPREGIKDKVELRTRGCKGGDNWEPFKGAIKTGETAVSSIDLARLITPVLLHKPTSLIPTF